MMRPPSQDILTGNLYPRRSDSFYEKINANQGAPLMAGTWLILAAIFKVLFTLLIFAFMAPRSLRRAGPLYVLENVRSAPPGNSGVMGPPHVIARTVIVISVHLDQVAQRGAASVAPVQLVHGAMQEANAYHAPLAHLWLKGKEN